MPNEPAYGLQPHQASRAPELLIEWTSATGLTLRLRSPTGSTLAILSIRRGPFSSTELMCEEILREYARPTADLDEQGIPSRLLQRHWLGHLISPKPRDCEICLRSQTPARQKQIENERSGYKSPRWARVPSPQGGQTTIKRLAPTKAAKAAPRPTTTKSARELGF